MISDFSYSTMGFSDRGLEAALDAIAAAGFTQTEILAQEPHLAELPAGPELSRFIASLKARGLWSRTVHAPLGKNVLGAPDEDWRRQSISVLADYIRFAGEIGSTDIVIHPIPNPIFVAGRNAPQITEYIGAAVRRSLDGLVPIAQAAGIRILLENLPYSSSYPFQTMSQLRPLLDNYSEQQVGLVIDTGHAWISGHDPAEEILLAGSRLGGTHLQDVENIVSGDCELDDKHWPPTQGDLDWDAIQSALVRVEYEGALTFEVQNSRYGESSDDLARIVHDIATVWISRVERSSQNE